MLLFCLVFAFILPLVKVPPQWSFRKPVEVVNVDTQMTHEKVTAGFTEASAVNANSTTTVSKGKTFKDQISGFTSLSLTEVLVLLYWIGVAVFAINFVFQLIVLLYRTYTKPFIQDGRYRIVELSGNQAPCSFGNSIFINPEKYEWDTYNQILLHEKIHIQQGHSYDIIFAEFALIFQWFNPFAWFYRKAVEDNLEFLTDHFLLRDNEVDQTSYQLSLVRVSAPHFPISLTTNYNQSVLKKRLIMMNAKKSNINTTWKYLFIAPLLLVFVCLINEPAANAKVLDSKSAKTVSKVLAIEDEGNWFATIKGNEVIVRFENDNQKNETSNNTFPLSEFKNLPRNQEGTFNINREAGEIVFKGKFTGNIGMGTYKFSSNPVLLDYLKGEGIEVNREKDAIVFFAIDLKKSYVEMLKRQGYKDITKNNLIPLAALKVDESFISSIKSNGFKDVSLEDLVPLKALGVDGKYIQDINKSGVKNLTVSQLITFKAQGITGDFIIHSQAASEKANVSTTKNDEEEEEDPASSRNSSPSIENMIAMKVMNVDAGFIKSFQDIGYKVSDENLIAMKALGITPQYVKSLESAGFKNIPSEEVISMKALNITAEEVKEFRKLGYNDITTEEIVSAKAIGVTPGYISNMKKKGYNLSSIQKYIEAKAVSGAQ
jgi:beta-lactamase regulating signal transducer with metallopeptidase domain